MKKLFAVFICLGLSGCYVPADYYYEDQYVVSDGYAAPAYSTTYISSAPSVVYVDQPVYYGTPIIYSHHHYAPPRHHHYNPPHSHHPAPRPHHGGGHHPQPAPHGGGHSGGSHHGGGHSGSGHGHHK